MNKANVLKLARHLESTRAPFDQMDCFHCMAAHAAKLFDMGWLGSIATLEHTLGISHNKARDLYVADDLTYDDATRLTRKQAGTVLRRLARTGKVSFQDLGRRSTRRSKVQRKAKRR